MIIPASTYTIKIPTKIYLRKYLLVKNGIPFPLNYNSTFGTLILCLLGKKSFDINMNDQKITNRIAGFNDHFIAISPISTMKNKGHSLTNDKIIAINRYLENEFAEELHKFCNDNIEKRNWRPGINKAIYQFAEKYGIEVDIDISFDALKQAEYRYRKRIHGKPQTFVL